MKMYITIRDLTFSHELIKDEKDDEILSTDVEFVGPIIALENGARKRLSEEDGLSDLVKWLQKAVHNYMSQKLAGGSNNV